MTSTSTVALPGRSRRAGRALVVGAFLVGGTLAAFAVTVDDTLDQHSTPYHAEQANIARGTAADSARLEAAADAFAGQRANIARGRAADSARLEAAADAFAGQQASIARGSRPVSTPKGSPS